MRQQGRSSKQETKELMDLDKLSKLKEEPHHLSGAYIRSLVKQLTSSRTKDPKMNNPNKEHHLVDMSKLGEGFSETPQHNQQQHQPQQQHKKQVRRRLHTSRPYQERLLNMAEARREIVTALKFHRAAMKQAASEQQPQEQQVQPQLPQLQPQQEDRVKSRRNPRIYPSSTANFPENLPYSSDISHQQYQHPYVPNPFSWTASTLGGAPPVFENFDFTLPNQTLGLNLNFQDFNNINITLYHNSNNNSNNNSTPFYSTSGGGSAGSSASASASSPSSYSSPSLSVATTSTDQEIPSSAAISQMEVIIEAAAAPAVADVIDCDSGGGLHAAMDDEEMAEIRSIGEQHQMEWNDTMNLVTSAWWFKVLKTMEVKGEDDDDIDGSCYHHPFDEVMEFPAWLNANESYFQQHHLNDFYSDDYFQDPALPCMDIGEIEGVDGEWWLA